VVTKEALDAGCSRYAQGGIAAAVAPGDSPELHLADTIAAGRGLCDEAAVRVLVEEGPRRVRELIDWGVVFDTQDGELMVGREAAHSRSRIIHARGDATGLEIESALIARLRTSGAAILERRRVLRLVVDDDGRCRGADLLDADTGTAHRIAATAIILASGGAGRLWKHTTNPEPATGDGVALAYDAGAEVADLEFVQFHPTALALEGAPRFLISEAVRGEGARIVNAHGERFLARVDARAELAPRDVVAQAIWEELQQTGEHCVYLDCSPFADRAVMRFPTIYETCSRLGIDLRTELVPIAPAAHYLIGGVRTDLWGATTLPGLYACGEVASCGVHGANRLASNSLLESVVFARRAAERALSRGAEAPPVSIDAPLPAYPRAPAADMTALMDRLRDVMWDGVGVVRDAASLRRAEGEIDAIADRCHNDFGAMASGLQASVTTASLICGSALAREESRGSHLRADFPESRNEWLGHWIMHREKGARFDCHPRAQN
jgi:L-aspartate oxidase